MYTQHAIFWRKAALALAMACLLPLAGLAAPLTESEAMRLGLIRPELADLARAKNDNAHFS